MSDLLTRAQITMLAQTLDTDPERLRSLERLGPDGLRALRERMSNLLFDELAVVFRRVSALAPLVPSALVAKVAEKAIPPLVGGRAGGALGVDHPDKVEGVLSRLSDRYMADAAPYLDPRTVAVLAPRMPGKPLVGAANELMRRRDYITAARFLDFATPELIRVFEEGIEDDEGVLLTGAYAQSADRLSEIIRLLPERRLHALVTNAAAGSTELRLAAVSLASRIAPDLQAKIGDIWFHGVEPEVLAEFVKTVVGEGAVAELRTVLAHVDDDVRDLGETLIKRAS